MKKEWLISDTVFQILRAKGMTQKKFSEETGIPQSTISDWKGKRLNPSSDRILRICKVLEVTPYELLNEEAPGTDADHIVAVKGAEEFDILVEYQKMEQKEKDRLLRYVEKLRKGKE